MKKLILIPLLALLAAGVPISPPVYNGNLKLFIADLGPAYPCHPLYDFDETWFYPDNTANQNLTIRKILDGLSNKGFNAIRLPMWPDSDKVFGPNPDPT